MDKTTLQLIFKAIRDSFKRSPIYTECLNNALSTHKGPRGGKLYDCALCKKPFKSGEIEADHILSVVELDRRWWSYKTEEYYSKVFCSLNNLRILCKPCHKQRTKEQKKLRK